MKVRSGELRMALLEFTRAATVAAVLFGLLAPPAVSGTPKPSIYFILTDDLGWNSVYHNNRTFTPFIDNLAATEGVKLTQHCELRRARNIECIPAALAVQPHVLRR